MSSSFEEAFKQGEEAKQRKELAVGESVGNELYDLLSDPALIKNASTKTSEAPSPEPPVPVSVTPIEAAQSPRPAPTTTESKIIPTELRNIYGDKVPARVLETFSKLKKPETIKNYLEQKKEEEETRKRKVAERKGRSGTRKPKRQDELQRTKTALQKEAAEEVRRMTVARATALKPSGADPNAPTVKVPVPAEIPVPPISPEAQKLEAEEQAEIDKRIAAERAAEAEEGTRLIKGMFGAGKEEAFDPHSVPSVDDSKVRAPQYAPRDMQEGMDTLNGEQKTDTLDRGEPQLTDPTGEKTRAPETVPLDTLKKTLQAQLEANPKIKNVNDVDIVEENGSLKLHMDFDVKQGNAAVEGSVVIEGGSPVFKDINATKYPVFGKSAVETAFAGFGAEIQKHFEQQYGQPISNIKVGASGLEIEFKPPTATEPATEPDGRIEPTLGPDGEPIDDLSPTPDGTQDWRTGWKGKLSEAVGKVVGGTKEKFEWWKSSEEGLIRRSKELDAEAEKMGVIGKTFLKMGEQYNKLGWKSKLAVGIGLGVGAGVSAATVSMPGIIAFTLGITAQRSLGLATMYLKYEKNTQEGEWRKEKAFGKAFAYTASMTGAMMLLSEGVKEGVEYAKQHQWDDRVHEWLGAMLGHKPVPSSELPKEVIAPKGIPDATPAAPAAAEAAPASPPEAPAAAAAAGEAPVISAEQTDPGFISSAGEVATAPAPEAPDISVEATKGRGYEYMMKRLWEDPRMANLKAEDYFKPGVPPEQQSDMYKLLTADAKTIDTVVHQIATDPKHGFFHADGTSVRIDMGSHLAVNAEGQLELNGAVQAPAGAPVTPVTPVYHPGAPSALTPETVVSPPPAETVDLTTAQDEAAKHISPPPLQEAPASATPSTPSAGEQPLTWRTGSGGELVDSSGNPVQAGVSESLPGANSFGIVVPEAEPHLYSTPGDEHLLAYGGSPAERTKTIWEYLIRNPEKIVYAADDSGKYRIPWHLVDGKAVAGPPMRTSGLMSLFSPWMKPPGPNDFERIIK